MELALGKAMKSVCFVLLLKKLKEKINKEGYV